MKQSTRNMIAISGIAIMALGFRLAWRTVDNTDLPFPIWEILLMLAGGVVIVVADPVSHN